MKNRVGLVLTILFVITLGVNVQARLNDYSSNTASDTSQAALKHADGVCPTCQHGYNDNEGVTGREGRKKDLDVSIALAITSNAPGKPKSPDDSTN